MSLRKISFKIIPISFKESDKNYYVRKIYYNKPCSFLFCKDI